MNDYQKQMQRFNVGEDCPVFDGLFEFCQISAGGSIAGAVKLNKRHTGEKIYLLVITENLSVII